MVKIHWSWIYRCICRKQATQTAFWREHLFFSLDICLVNKSSEITHDRDHYIGEAQGSWLFCWIWGMIGNARRNKFLCLFVFNAKWINKLCIITAYSKLAKANGPFAFPRWPFYITTSLGDNLVDPCLFSRSVLSKRNFLQWQKCFISTCLIWRPPASNDNWHVVTIIKELNFNFITNFS